METPQINTNALVSNTYGGDSPISFPGRITIAPQENPHWSSEPERKLVDKFLVPPDNILTTTTMETEIMSDSDRRIVQVFIIDPDQAVIIEDAVIYQGEQLITDLTDEELFFEVPIKDLLEKHNEIRLATLDKKATKKIGKDVFLESIRIRDLRMTVVEIATF